MSFLMIKARGKTVWRWSPACFRDTERPGSSSPTSSGPSRGRWRKMRKARHGPNRHGPSLSGLSHYTPGCLSLQESSRAMTVRQTQPDQPWPPGFIFFVLSKFTWRSENTQTLNNHINKIANHFLWGTQIFMQVFFGRRGPCLPCLLIWIWRREMIIVPQTRQVHVQHDIPVKSTSQWKQHFRSSRICRLIEDIPLCVQCNTMQAKQRLMWFLNSLVFKSLRVRSWILIICVRQIEFCWDTIIRFWF